MRVLVAMSGGVDSSVAAALAVADYGRESVVGATLKLWGGDSDSGCCSVADVEDARRVADRLGIVHHVFNFTEDFEARVVGPYVSGHAAGRTPNPCIECNRHVKFDRLLDRARVLGFDVLATGHHARVRRSSEGVHQLCRGADADKDQSYVLSMLTRNELARVAFPVGELTKREVRSEAARLGLCTASKPDSQDVCFIRSDEGREAFLATRLTLHQARMVDHESGREVGSVPAVELVTVGQRRGMGHGSDGRRRYVTAVDVAARTVVVGPPEAADAREARLAGVVWADGSAPPSEQRVLAQCSAHGRPLPAVMTATGPEQALIRFDMATRRVAPGQTVALYHPAEPEVVLGSGIQV